MEITPNEMRNQSFASSMRGYNKAEVDAFIQGAADALEEAKAELQKMREEKKSLESKYEEVRRLEDSIKSAVIEAQKTADQIKLNANKEAELIVTEAKQNRDRIIDEQNRRITELETAQHQIEQTKNSFYAKLRAEILAHLKLVDSIVTPAADKNAAPETPPPPQYMDTPEQPETDPEEKPVEETPPPLEMQEEEIDSVVDQFGESSDEHKEEVKNGQSQGNDF